MELNKKEKYIKSVLEGQTGPLDKDLLWDSIESKVSSLERRRPFIWFFSGVAMAVILLVSGYAIFTKLYTSEDTAKLVSEKAPERLDEINTGINEVTSNFGESQNRKQQNATTDNISKQDRQTIADHRTTEYVIPTQSETYRSQNPLPTNAASPGIETVRAIEGAIPGDHNWGDQVTTEESIRSNIKPATNLAVLAVLNPLLAEPIRLGDIDMLHAPVVKVNESANGKWLPALVWRTGVNKTMSSANLGNQDALLSAGEFEKEEGQYGYSSSLFFQMENPSGWKLGIGFGYQRATVRYSNFDVLQSSSSEPGIESIYTDRNGNVTTSNGTVNEVSITEYNRIWYRHHDAYQLWANAGKEILRLQRVSLFAEAGVGYSLTNRHTGYYFDNVPGGSVLIEEGDHPYKTKGIVYLQAGLGVAYDMKNFQIQLLSGFSIQPQSITNENYFYQVKHKQLGLQLGLAYRWNQSLFK